MKKYRIAFDMKTDKNFIWERFGCNIKAVTISFLDAVNKEFGEYPVFFNVTFNEVWKG